MRCLIVGSGLAGISLAAHLSARQVDVEVIASDQPSASGVSAGILNPTVLKRYTAAWNNTAFMDYALLFYRQLEVQLKATFIDPLPIHRIFSTPSEANEWTVASDHPSLAPYLEASLQQAVLFPIHAPMGYGQVLNVGRLNIKSLMDHHTQFLGIKHRVALFDYDQLNLSLERPEYQGVSYDHLFFCEGAQLKNNPWFGQLPLVRTKGEMLLIRCAELPQTAIWKGPVFIVPLGEGIFWVGASFDWEEKNNVPTDNGRFLLEKKLKQMLKAPYTLVDHLAGVRPTVIDRRPLLGTHSTHKRLHVFNGLGTRGGMMAPLLAQWICRAVLDGAPLPNEVSIDRFA